MVLVVEVDETQQINQKLTHKGLGLTRSIR